MGEDYHPYLEPYDNPKSKAILAPNTQESDKIDKEERGIVLVSGIPGSGKSEVARMLSTALEATMLRSDSIRQQVLQDTPKDQWYTDKNKEKVYRAMVNSASTADTRQVILDATWGRKKDRQQIYQQADKMGIPVKIVHVVSPDMPTEIRMKTREETSDPSQAKFVDRRRHSVKSDPIERKHIVIINNDDLPSLEKQVVSIVRKPQNRLFSVKKTEAS